MRKVRARNLHVVRKVSGGLNAVENGIEFVERRRARRPMRTRIYESRRKITPTRTRHPSHPPLMTSNTSCPAVNDVRINNNNVSRKTSFSKVVGISVISNFFISGAINMAMVMGLMPVVGIPLPLVSYGGSSMITYFFGFGLLLSIELSHKIHKQDNLVNLPLLR